jgi:hypothetical protein
MAKNYIKGQKWNKVTRQKFALKSVFATKKGCIVAKFALK